MDRHQACESVEPEARYVAGMLDSGRNTQQATQRLLHDFSTYSPMQSKCLAQQIERLDDKRVGDNASIVQTRDGKEMLRIDPYEGPGRLISIPQLPNVTLFDNAPVRREPSRDYDDDRRYQGQPRYGDPQGAYEPRHDGRPRQGQDAVTGAVVDGVIGGVTGAAIDGRRGAIAGGAGGVVGDVVRRNGGTGNVVTDTVVQGVAGAVVGGAIDGNKGAKAGAVGAILPGVLKGFFGGDQR